MGPTYLYLMQNRLLLNSKYISHLFSLFSANKQGTDIETNLKQILNKFEMPFECSSNLTTLLMVNKSCTIFEFGSNFVLNLQGPQIKA